MQRTIQEDFLYKKVYEFSYAVMRIASSAKSSGTTELLEEKALFLLDSVLIADYGKTKNIIYSILTLCGFMVDAGLLHPLNREVLIKESENIDFAIQALPKKNVADLPNLNLEKIFSKSNFPINPVRDRSRRQASAMDTFGHSVSNGIKRQFKEKNENQSEIADKTIADEIADRTSDEANSFKSETRQSAIINKLQTKENCRLNELQELFPDISKRTLRYDIESLISKGFVERMGSRRNSVYSLKNKNSAIIELPSPAINNSVV